ncbi:SnoaL-like domain-containing protein [Sungkyunkwania multivorans]|uniref:SnoaL-like domain-containing protein n=1 Tax=Sungkyunkwania multivorans TaxID=1173618 RepID=A0ABW3CVG1_9FLAO
MTTQQVADKLVSMCREGKNLEAIEQLYADDIVSREMPGMPDSVVSGIKAVYEKSEKWLENVEEFHEGKISDPIIAGDHFTCTMDYDVTFKDRGRAQMKEVCVFQVKDGKIVNEQFFYDMPEM